MSPELRALSQRSVHPALPVLLTKKGPLMALIHAARSIKQRIAVPAYSEFETWTRPMRSRTHESLALPDGTLCCATAILREISEETSY